MADDPDKITSPPILPHKMPPHQSPRAMQHHLPRPRQFQKQTCRDSSSDSEHSTSGDRPVRPFLKNMRGRFGRGLVKLKITSKKFVTKPSPGSAAAPGVKNQLTVSPFDKLKRFNLLPGKQHPSDSSSNKGDVRSPAKLKLPTHNIKSNQNQQHHVNNKHSITTTTASSHSPRPVLSITSTRLIDKDRSLENKTVTQQSSTTEDVNSKDNNTVCQAQNSQHICFKANQVSPSSRGEQTEQNGLTDYTILKGDYKQRDVTGNGVDYYHHNVFSDKNSTHNSLPHRTASPKVRLTNKKSPEKEPVHDSHSNKKNVSKDLFPSKNTHSNGSIKQRSPEKLNGNGLVKTASTLEKRKNVITKGCNKKHIDSNKESFHKSDSGKHDKELESVKQNVKCSQDNTQSHSNRPKSETQHTSVQLSPKSKGINNKSNGHSKWSPHKVTSMGNVSSAEVAAYCNKAGAMLQEQDISEITSSLEKTLANVPTEETQTNCSEQDAEPSVDQSLQEIDQADLAALLPDLNASAATEAQLLNFTETSHVQGQHDRYRDVEEVIKAAIKDLGPDGTEGDKNNNGADNNSSSSEEECDVQKSADEIVDNAVQMEHEEPIGTLLNGGDMDETLTEEEICEKISKTQKDSECKTHVSKKKKVPTATLR